jgi:uncharacterized protein YqeY
MSPANALKERIRADLKQAMKDGRKAEAALLRTLLAAIDNAEAPAQTAEQSSAMAQDFGKGAAEVARLDLSREQLDTVLAGEIDARMKAAEEMDRLGQDERAEMLRAEAGLAWRYL